MYTANTMASAIEALGLSLAEQLRAGSRVGREAQTTAGAPAPRSCTDQARHQAVRHPDARRRSRTRSRPSSRSADRPTRCCTCSRSRTRRKVDLTLDDFTRIGKRVPVLADVRPSGRYLMSELIRIGGIQPLMKTLLDAGLLHGDCLTVTGRRSPRTSRRCGRTRRVRTIVRPLANPIKNDSHLAMLYGNLAPEGAVAKISGKEGLRFAGRARVFDCEEHALRAILDGTVAPATWS